MNGILKENKRNEEEEEEKESLFFNFNNNNKRQRFIIQHVKHLFIILNIEVSTRKESENKFHNFISDKCFHQYNDHYNI